VDRETVLAKLKYYLETPDRDAAHEIYHEDAVLVFPQSGERFEGVENFRPWRSSYPAEVEFEIQDVRGQGDFWVGEVRLRYDGGSWNHGVSIMEFRDDRISRETIYYGEAWEAPQWRQQWRAAPVG
jgi:hypothetical protein